jgi:hypothetical protein
MIGPQEALDRTVELLRRDLLPATDPAAIVNALVTTRVRIIADEAALAHASGRTALVATASVIGRLGAVVTIDIPDRIANDGLPPLDPAPASLRDALARHLDRLITPVDSKPTAAAELTISLGAPTTPHTICIGGTGYSATLLIGENAGGWEGTEPFGPLMAASAAGAEVARAVVRRLAQSETIAGFYRDKLEPRGVTLALPPLVRSSPATDLGRVDLVSGGAVTHALLLSLLRHEEVAADLRVFDDEDTDATNLNRYALLGADGLGIPKTELLERLSTSAIRIRGERQRIALSHGPADGFAARVCVGTDNVEGRHDVQRLAPGWIGVGATSHTQIWVSEHVPGGPCAGCKHASSEELEPRLPTISFVSLLAGTLLSYLLVRDARGPVSNRTQLTVLDAMNLGGNSLLIEHVQSNPDCPLECTPSRAISLTTSHLLERRGENPGGVQAA